MSTPDWAPRPTPTMIDIGVAKPSAQGQAMMSTETAAIRPKVSRGSGPNSDQPLKASTATASTSGTNQPETRSASRWIGAWLRCACATMATIRASIVYLPTLSARITKVPATLIVPPITLSPADLRTGIDSPVTIDSSTVLRPSMTSPSTGTFSPGLTRSRSPTTTAASGTSSSLPSGLTRRQVFGVRSSSARMAPLVCSRALSSSTCPSRTRTVITAAASK